MDRRRTGSPVLGRQLSNESRGSSMGSSSPSMSPAHPSSRFAYGTSTIKRTQNVAAKAAAARLAQVMASQTTDEDDDDDDLGFRYSAPPPPAPSSFNSSLNISNRSSSNSSGYKSVGSVIRPNRSPSPAVIELACLIPYMLLFAYLFYVILARSCVEILILRLRWFEFMRNSALQLS